MLTEAPNGANASPRAVMWTVAEVAARDGVSKPTVSVRVKRFVEQHGLTVERDALGRVARLNVAEYDALRGRYDDPSKAQASARTTAPVEDRETYDEALRQKTWHEAEKRRIELAQIKGQLIETAAVADGYDRAAQKILDTIGRLDEHCDDLAAVVGREGSRGLQTAMKKLVVELQRDIAAALRSEADTLRAMITENVQQQ
ncbi:hypothetical protein Ms3S1_15580 [Methylosinus sp. 3S-1]